MSKIKELLKPAPLHKTIPALAGAPSIGRIAAAWRAFRAATGRKQRTKLDQIPADDRRHLARSYRTAAVGFVALAGVMGTCAWLYSTVLSITVTTVLALAAASYLFVAVLRLWQAAMIERGRGVSFKAFLASGLS
ncbi:MAG: hypothetical protein K8I04_06865 [Gammaproteobacteria bacterium]|nr:hypothetical protein [Gammaproteobacteria bacterium]